MLQCQSVGRVDIAVSPDVQEIIPESYSLTIEVEFSVSWLIVEYVIVFC
jgi:hypothetical protein